MPTRTLDLRLPCRSGWCAARGLALIALWLALVAGFLADTTVAAAPAPGGARTVAERPAETATTS